MRPIGSAAVYGLLWAVVGCAPMLPARTVAIAAPFDVAAAREAVGPGTNTISGSALLLQRGGGVVTCAGNVVWLIPATAYADARMQAIYGSSFGGYVPVAGPQLAFEPDLPEYKSAQRTERCDAQGNFVFERVHDGVFYVITDVRWQVGYAAQGGHLMRRESVKDGSVVRSILTQ